jgi:hypothetical protein
LFDIGGGCTMVAGSERKREGREEVIVLFLFNAFISVIK